MYQEILKKTQLFQQLSDEQINKIASDVLEREFPADTLIVKIGEIGDCLHVILSGSAQVFIHDKNGKEIVLARLEKGQFFGEQALLNIKPTRRNASVRALTQLKTLSLSHKAFQDCLDSQLIALVRKIGESELIKNIVAELQDTKAEQNQLTALLSQYKTYAARDVFFRQGDLPQHAYYLLSGSVEIRIYNQDHRVQALSLVYPGQFFGELAILDGTPRAAMATALTESKVATISADQLKKAYAGNENLKALLTTQRRLYQVPSLGVVTQFQSHIQGSASLNTVIQKATGETILASRLLNANFFTIYYEGISGSREQFKDQEGRSREITLAEGKLVGIASIGQWDDLQETSQLIYERPTLTRDDLASFHQSGIISRFSNSSAGFQKNVCECMQVQAQTIQDCILHGASTIEEISKKTGAGTVCGGCRPRILELLGGNAWTYVRIVDVQEHTPKVKSFRFQLLGGSYYPSLPGQHIVVEGYIDGHWVCRSYTLTSLSENMDHYEITVKKEDNGIFSPWLFANHMKNPRLRISAPQGSFVFDPSQSTAAICFMAGIGVTPAIAFMRSLISHRSTKMIYLHYSVREIAEAIFQKEMADWSRQYPNIKIQLRSTSQSGHLNREEIQQIINQFPDADIYICGPKLYEQDLLKILNEQKIPPNKIHKEEFNHAAGPGERIK